MIRTQHESVRKILALIFLIVFLNSSHLFGQIKIEQSEKRIAFDVFSDEQYWDLARDTNRLKRELSSWDLVFLKDPEPALVWSFTPRAVSFNDLFLRKTIELDFQRLIVTVQNLGEPFDFSLKVEDASRADWTVAPVHLKGHDIQRRLVFELKDFTVAPWSADHDGNLDFPVKYVAFIARGLESGTRYKLKISGAEIVLNPSPQAKIIDMELPEEWEAGRNIRTRLKLQLISGQFSSNQANLELILSGKKHSFYPLQSDSPLIEWRVGENREFWIEGARLSEYVSGGTFPMILRLSGMETILIGDEGKEVSPEVRLLPRIPGNTIAEVKLYKGRPTLFIDGNPDPGMAYATYRPSVEVFRDFTRAGVDLFMISGTPTESGYGHARTVWIAPDRFDYSQLDQRIGMILEANPHAYIIPRLYLHAPLWWSHSHPDELVTYDPGDGHPVLFLDSEKKPAPSWASKAWRHDTAKALEKLIDHIQNAPYGDRVIGYHLASGTTDEWMQWGVNEDQWTDYSTANMNGFRIWLDRKYGGDQFLQEAWNDAGATLRTARIPSKRDRMNCKMGTLRDPSAEQSSIDYCLYTSDLVAETMMFFASVVKKATDNEKIVGVFYGYVLELAGNQRQQNAGHLALRDVLDCPDIDFITSPSGYAFREIGTGTPYTMSLLDAVMNAGKLWFTENDMRTSLSPGDIGRLGKPPDIHGDLLAQRRELASVLSRGQAQWWFDAGGNRYDTPELMEEIGHLCDIAQELIDADRSPVDEIAFVLDTESLAFMEIGNALSQYLIREQIPEAFRIGAPIGWYELSDIANLPVRKMYVFLNVFAPSDDDVKAIQSLMQQAKVMVFLYAPGVYSSDGFDAQAAEDLLGYPLRHQPQVTKLSVRIEGNDPLIASLKGIRYGTEKPIKSFFTPEDGEWERLGVLPDGAPGLVVVKRGGCKVAFSAAPALPGSLLRRFAEEAGVHLYIDTQDIVWATKELLAVSVDKKGKRQIRLPEAGRVYSVYDKESLQEPTECFDADFSNGETKLWLVK